MAKYIQTFIKGAKRLEGERESGPNDTERGGGRRKTQGERERGQNDSGAKGKVGETTRTRTV